MCAACMCMYACVYCVCMCVCVQWKYKSYTDPQNNNIYRYFAVCCGSSLTETLCPQHVWISSYVTPYYTCKLTVNAM